MRFSKSAEQEKLTYGESEDVCAGAVFKLATDILFLWLITGTVTSLGFLKKNNKLFKCFLNLSYFPGKFELRCTVAQT